MASLIIAEHELSFIHAPIYINLIGCFTSVAYLHYGWLFLCRRKSRCIPTFSLLIHPELISMNDEGTNLRELISLLEI